MIRITEQDVRPTPLGTALRIQIEREDKKPMSFREVWDAFAEHYPGKWAIQCFPPEDRLIDQANKYHLYVVSSPMDAFDLCLDAPKGTRRP